LATRPPSQIVDTVVFWVAVDVQALHTLRAGGDKHLKHQPVDVFLLPFTGLPEPDPQLPVGLFSWPELLPPPNDSDLPGVAYFIEPLVPDHWFPGFVDTKHSRLLVVVRAGGGGWWCAGRGTVMAEAAIVLRMPVWCPRAGSLTR